MQAPVPETILLMFGVLPLWLMAGWADWWMHRRSHIERTAGVRESLLHLLMLAEMAIAVLAVLWLEINAAVLALCIVAFLAHEITVYADLRWSAGQRQITPLEQMIHSVQEIMPLVGLALLASSHWDQASALVGLGGAGGEDASWSFTLKRVALPGEYVASAVLAGAALAACYVEELWRCMKARATPTHR